MTVMFCDVANSTALFRRLDPEDEREVILSYRQACERTVSHFGGFVSKFVGDGVQACFGYPQAHDHDAVMAVGAAAALVDEVHKLNSVVNQRYGIDLRIRIAVHTGLVVAGEMGTGLVREASSFAGGVFNIAARLQELAEPNTVVLSKDTYQLVQEFFACRELPPARLKGLPDPVSAFQVLDHRHLASDATSLHRRSVPPLIGRDEELARMMTCWHQAIAGVGQAVVLAGEPGIGKSRLVRALRDALIGEAHESVVLHCSEHTRNSALSPVIDHLKRLLQYSEEDDPTKKLEKLEAKVSLFGQDSPDVVPLLAALLDVTIPEKYAKSELSIEAKRRRTMEILVSALVTTASKRPVLLVVEDLHWADASTLDLISLLHHQLHGSPILVVLSTRPEFDLPSSIQKAVTHIDLARLSSTHVRTMVTNLTRGETLHETTVKRLVEKAEGVPLFVEELTKMVLDTGGLEDVTALEISPHETAIPATLQSSLMARLDRLGSAKTVAQIAATLGRTFSYDLLRAIYPSPDAELRAGLTQLVNSEILFQRLDSQRGRSASSTL